MYVVTVGLLVAVGVEFFATGKFLHLGAGKFAGCEAVFLDAHRLAEEALDGFVFLAGLGDAFKCKCVFGLGDDVVVIISVGGGEWRVGALYEFCETALRHIVDEVLDFLRGEVLDGVFERVGPNVALEIDGDCVAGLLLVFLAYVDGFVVVWNGVINERGRTGGVGEVGEVLLYLGFYLGNVDVANYDNRLMVRMVPSLVIIFEVLVGEVVNDVHKTDWHTTAVFAAGEEGLDAALHHSVPRSGAHTPFAVDDSALVVDFGVGKGERAAPIAEYHQARVDEPTVFVGGYVVDVIDCLVETRVGVEFAAKTYTVFFEHLDEAFAGEMLAAVERHMFEEVRESALVFLFLH